MVSLTASPMVTSSSPSIVRPGRRVTHQRWRNVLQDRTALIMDTFVLQAVTGITRQSLQVEDSQEDSKEDSLEDSPGVNQEDNKEEVGSVGELGAVTTALVTPATAPASVWWVSVRRCTTTGHHVW